MVDIVLHYKRLSHTIGTWKTVNTAEPSESKFFLVCVQLKSLKSEWFFKITFSIHVQQRHFIWNSLADVILNAWIVQNSPPNKCIPRILFVNYQKIENNKTQSECFFVHRK